jgi:hypothetical protein
MLYVTFKSPALDACTIFNLCILFAHCIYAIPGTLTVNNDYFRKYH